jgi:hypothetical protein
MLDHRLSSNHGESFSGERLEENGRYDAQNSARTIDLTTKNRVQ